MGKGYFGASVLCTSITFRKSDKREAQISSNFGYVPRDEVNSMGSSPSVIVFERRSNEVALRAGPKPMLPVLSC